MVPIAENIKDRIKSLHADKCKVKEIQAKIRSEFGKEVSYSTMYYIFNPHRKEKQAERTKARKQGRKPDKRSPKLDAADEPLEDIEADIYRSIDTLKATYIEKFKEIRRSLIEAVGKLRQEKS